MPDVAWKIRDHPPKRLMGYYDIRQIPLFFAANDKRPVHLIYPFVGKPWPINHCQHLSGLPPPGVGNLWLCSSPTTTTPVPRNKEILVSKLLIRINGAVTLQMLHTRYLRYCERFQRNTSSIKTVPAEQMTYYWVLLNTWSVHAIMA